MVEYLIRKQLTMKRLFVYITILPLFLTGCQNQPVSFDDYELKAVYFPYQRPLRTLSLGEDRLDNSLDKEGKFDIGVSIGGMYEQKWNWTVDYILDNSILENVYTNSDPALKILSLPSQYYTLSPTGTVSIPKGSFNGLIRVELTDAFFNDSLSLTGLYVIPLRLTATSADSILQGKPAISNPDPRVIGDWESNKYPKNWVMFGIKYINAYHGTYLHRGHEVITDKTSGDLIETVVFRNKYVEYDLLIKLISTGRRTAVSNGLANRTGGDYSMNLEFANDKGNAGSVTITPADGSIYQVTGSGQYFDKASSTESWTGLTFQSMYLSYTWEEEVDTVNHVFHVHNVKDTLVFRDRGIKFEENAIQIIEP